jgi:hypothetical protein
MQTSRIIEEILNASKNQSTVNEPGSWVYGEDHMSDEFAVHLNLEHGDALPVGLKRIAERFEVDARDFGQF